MFKTVPLYTDISPEMSFPFVSRLINATAASQLAIIDALLSTLRFTRLGLQEMKVSRSQENGSLLIPSACCDSTNQLPYVSQHTSRHVAPFAETVINATAENNLV